MAFAACQHVTRFQVSKCDCKSQHINHKVIVLSKCLGSRCSVLRYRRDEFPNLCLLASDREHIRVNSSVERTFSFVTNILSNKHLSISYYTLENSVVVSGNNSIWSEKEREEIIDHVLEISANTESPRFPLKQTRSRN